MSHEITIASVEIYTDYDDEGHPAVTATVDGLPTVWYVAPRHCSAGRDGWEIGHEAGCLDSDIEESLGHAEALRIGREVVALANYGLASGTLARLCECASTPTGRSSARGCRTPGRVVIARTRSSGVRS